MDVMESFDVLEFMYESNTHTGSFRCRCESCGKEYDITRITVRRDLKKGHRKLLCKSCRCRLAKLSYSDDRKKEINDRRTATNLERYGCGNTWQLEKVKEISSANWETRKKRIEESMLEKYGATNAMHVEEFRKKMSDTSRKNDPGFRKRVAKIRKTNMEKRGAGSSFQEPGFREKALETQIQTYGRPVYSRTYMYNGICFDSSWELAYYIWLTDSHIDFVYQPEVDFRYIGDDGKEHQYHPDFYAFGEYQEIKGDQFYNEAGEPYDCINRKYWWEKYNCAAEHGVHILRWPDLRFIMEYVSATYGKGYLKSFKKKIRKQ